MTEKTRTEEVVELIKEHGIEAAMLLVDEFKRDGLSWHSMSDGLVLFWGTTHSDVIEYPESLISVFTCEVSPLYHDNDPSYYITEKTSTYARCAKPGVRYTLYGTTR